MTLLASKAVFLLEEGLPEHVVIILHIVVCQQLIHLQKGLPSSRNALTVPVIAYILHTKCKAEPASHGSQSIALPLVLAGRNSSND